MGRTTIAPWITIFIMFKVDTGSLTTEEDKESPVAINTLKNKI